MEALKKYKKETGFVYSRTNNNDKPENGILYSDRFRCWLKYRKLPKTRFHDLRHFNATMMLKQGISDKEASARLGHTEIPMTKKYQHVLESMEKRAAEALNSIVAGRNGGQKDE